MTRRSPVYHSGARPDRTYTSQPDLPPEIEQVINKALDKDRELRYQSASELRYQSASELRTDLKRVRRQSESGFIPAPPISAPATKAVPAVSGSVLARHWKALLYVAAGVAIVVGAILFFHSRSATALGERDTIVLADFVNTTGDPVFDDTLKQALAVQLEQSPFLNILSDRKVAATMKLMDRSPEQPLTGEVARKLCPIENTRKAYELREWVVTLHSTSWR